MVTPDLLSEEWVRGAPEVQVRLRRSEGGERRRRRKGIARNMLRGESCCGCGDDDDDDSDGSD